MKKLIPCLLVVAISLSVVVLVNAAEWGAGDKGAYVESASCIQCHPGWDCYTSANAYMIIQQRGDTVLKTKISKDLHK